MRSSSHGYHRPTTIKRHATVSRYRTSIVPVIISSHKNRKKRPNKNTRRRTRRREKRDENLDVIRHRPATAGRFASHGSYSSVLRPV